MKLKLTNPETQGFSSERLGRLSSHLQGYITKKYVRGINGMIARNGELVYAQSFGKLGKSAKKLSMDSLFRIYSMTKPVTSVAALMLYEEGKFLLDDPVAKYLPYFKDTKVQAGTNHQGLKLEPQASPMSIRDLFTHMAGLSYGWHQDTPVDALYRATGVQPGQLKLADFVELLSSLPLVFQPGTNWRYSHATDVLGHLVQVIADEPLENFMKTRIFKPLGMKDTSFSVSKRQAERLTSVYAPVKRFQFGFDYSTLPKGKPTYPIDTPEQSIFINPQHAVSGFSGGGGLISTMPDYLNFAQMLLNKGQFNDAQLLGRKTVELMSLNHVAKHIRPLEIGGNPMMGVGFGLGVSVIEDAAQNAKLGSVGNYAWSGAAMTSFWIDPVENLVGLMMTQFMPNDFYRIPDEFQVLAYQALVD